MFQCKDLLTLPSMAKARIIAGVNLQAKCHFFLSKIGTSSTLKTLKIP